MLYIYWNDVFISVLICVKLFPRVHMNFTSKMYLPATIVFLLPLLVESANVVLSNDDGWAEINVRTFYRFLTNAGNSVVLSAPADNESGTGI